MDTKTLQNTLWTTAANFCNEEDYVKWSNNLTKEEKVTMNHGMTLKDWKSKYGDEGVFSKQYAEDVAAGLFESHGIYQSFIG